MKRKFELTKCPECDNKMPGSSIEGHLKRKHFQVEIKNNVNYDVSDWCTGELNIKEGSISCLNLKEKIYKAHEVLFKVLLVEQKQLQLFHDDLSSKIESFEEITSPAYVYVNWEKQPVMKKANKKNILLHGEVLPCGTKMYVKLAEHKHKMYTISGTFHDIYSDKSLNVDKIAKVSKVIEQNVKESAVVISNEASVSLFVMKLLENVISLLENEQKRNTKIECQKNLYYDGRRIVPDFVVLDENHGQGILVVEVKSRKKLDKNATRQHINQLYAANKMFNTNKIYGAVTSFEKWTFFSLEGRGERKTVSIHAVETGETMIQESAKIILTLITNYYDSKSEMEHDRTQQKVLPEEKKENLNVQNCADTVIPFKKDENRKIQTKENQKPLFGETSIINNPIQTLFHEMASK